MSTISTEPTAEALRGVAVMADGLLLIHSARAYGLITGGPDIDVDRCEEIIDRAHAAGHTWTKEDTEAAAIAIAQEVNRG